MNYPFFIIAILVVFLAGCQNGVVFEKQYDLKDAAWTYADTLDFEFEIEDTLKIYNLYLDIAHSTEYGFENLYINIYTQFPTGERIKELVSLELADKGGIWLGDCDAESCELEVPIQENAFFNLPGKYKITLEQYMRKNPLEGIIRMGLKIKDTGQTKQ